MAAPRHGARWIDPGLLQRRRTAVEELFASECSRVWPLQGERRRSKGSTTSQHVDFPAPRGQEPYLKMLLLRVT